MARCAGTFDLSAGIGEVFKLEYWFVAYTADPMPAAQASVAACELSIGYVSFGVSCQLSHTRALILGKLFGICVVSASVIHAAFLAPPSPASMDAHCASMIGLFGARVSNSL